MPKNPTGFPQRLRWLMDGAGYNSRDINRLTGGEVSHQTVEYWLKDEVKAGDSSVDVVAKIFGWETPELLYGRPPLDAATRIAELEGALGVLRRTLTEALTATNAALGSPNETPSATAVEEPVAEPEPPPRVAARAKAHGKAGK